MDFYRSCLGGYTPKAPVNDEAKQNNQNLPGMGGIFNHINANLYAYGANNPVRYIDPDGRDVILLNRSWGADYPMGPYGHNAVLTGDDQNGWMYYSKDGLFTNNAIKFNTLQDFIDYNNSLDTPVKLSYDRACRVKTTPEDDRKACAEAEKMYQRPYNVCETKNKKGETTSQNCADLSADIISTYSGLNIKKIKISRCIGKIDININFFNLVDMHIEKKLDINTSITWPNAQFYDFYFSNKNAQMIDIFDESAVEKRKQAQFDQMMHDAHIY